MSTTAIVFIIVALAGLFLLISYFLSRAKKTRENEATSELTPDQVIIKSQLPETRDLPGDEDEQRIQQLINEAIDAAKERNLDLAVQRMAQAKSLISDWKPYGQSDSIREQIWDGDINRIELYIRDHQ